MKMKRVMVRGIDGWWLKVLGWGMGGWTLEWTQDRDRAFSFIAGDRRLKEALGRLEAQGVDVGRLEQVEDEIEVP